jgi:general secretion pathway protein C
MSTKHKWSDLTSGDRGRALSAANNLLPAWVSLALVILIGWQLAKVVWALVPAPAAGTPVVAPASGKVSASSGSPAESTSATTIASAHLFGVADEEEPPPPPAENLDELEATNLRNLTLRGTITSDRPEYSIAIISDSGDEEKVYVVGDSVASGATLHAVEAHRVVLNESGVLTELKLPREFSAQAAPRTVTRAPAVRQATETEPSIQSVVAQNVSRLADVIRPTPYFVNGEQQGFRVYPGRNRAQFQALGLRPGDLIREIDGQSLADQTQAMQIFQSLGEVSQVTVTVERDGNPETLVLNTEQLDIGEEVTQ